MSSRGRGPSTEEKKPAEDVFNGTEMHPVSPAGLANAEQQNHNNRVGFGPNIAASLEGNI